MFEKPHNKLRVVKPRAGRKRSPESPFEPVEVVPEQTQGTSGGDMKMSSLEIAELTGKSHAHVMRDTRKMLSGLGKDPDPYLDRRADSQGQQRAFFLLDHDLTMTLVSGYNVKLRHAVIVRLRELETGEATPWHMQEPEPEPSSGAPAAPALPDFTNPAEAARAWADQHDRADSAEVIACRRRSARDSGLALMLLFFGLAYCHQSIEQK